MNTEKNVLNTAPGGETLISSVVIIKVIASLCRQGKDTYTLPELIDLFESLFAQCEASVETVQ